MGYNSNIFLLMPKWDADALAFILAHEASTGLSMGEIQKKAINNFYKSLKGIGTPNGSNIYSLAVSSGARIFPLCPTNNSTASANAYKLDMISNGVISGTYNNFVSGDFTPNGVIGGATKYFNAGISPSAYPQNNFSYGYYNRTSTQQLSFECGTNNLVVPLNYNSIAIRYSTGSVTFWRVNESTPSSGIPTVSAANSLGLITCSRSDSSNEFLYKGTTQLSTRVLASSTPTSNNMYFHGINNGGSLVQESTRQLCGYFIGLPHLTANQRIDLNFSINLFNTEIITGGRQV